MLPAPASPGTAIDAGYAALEAIARAAVDVGAEPGARAGTQPPGHANPALPACAGRTVALVHPWALGRRPPGEFVLGVVHAPAHAALPWSARRWNFVLAGMRARCDAIWAGDLGEIAPALRRARRLLADAAPLPGYLDALGDTPEIRVPERAAGGGAAARVVFRLSPVVAPARSGTVSPQLTLRPGPPAPAWRRAAGA